MPSWRESKACAAPVKKKRCEFWKSILIDQLTITTTSIKALSSNAYCCFIGDQCHLICIANVLNECLSAFATGFVLMLN